MGKSAVPVVVPVMPKLTPEVLEGKDDEGGWVDNEEGMVDELVPVWQFAPRMSESKKAMQVNVAFVKTLWERIPLQFPAEAETGGSEAKMQREKVWVSLPRWRWTAVTRNLGGRSKSDRGGTVRQHQGDRGPPKLHRFDNNLRSKPPGLSSSSKNPAFSLSLSLFLFGH